MGGNDACHRRCALMKRNRTMMRRNTIAGCLLFDAFHSATDHAQGEPPPPAVHHAPADSRIVDIISSKCQAGTGLAQTSCRRQCSLNNRARIATPSMGFYLHINSRVEMGGIRHHIGSRQFICFKAMDFLSASVIATTGALIFATCVLSHYSAATSALSDRTDIACTPPAK